MAFEEVVQERLGKVLDAMIAALCSTMLKLTGNENDGAMGDQVREEGRRRRTSGCIINSPKKDTIQ